MEWGSTNHNEPARWFNDWGAQFPIVRPRFAHHFGCSGYASFIISDKDETATQFFHGFLMLSRGWTSNDDENLLTYISPVECTQYNAIHRRFHHRDRRTDFRKLSGLIIYVWQCSPVYRILSGLIVGFLRYYSLLRGSFKGQMIDGTETVSPSNHKSALWEYV